MRFLVMGSLFLSLSATAGVISPGSFGKIHKDVVNKSGVNCKTDLYDNDSIVEECKARGEYFPRHDIGSRTNRYSYREVMQTFSPYLEAKFSTFIVANTAVHNRKVKNTEHLVRPQHLLVLRKKPGFEQIFLRNSEGMVVGVDFNRVEEDLNGVPNLIKTSSGNGNGGIRTFSGIFTVNKGKSRSRRNRSWRAAMSNAIYLAYRYGHNGRWTGVAMHGTPGQRNWNRLGTRASHGCLRVHPKWAEKLWPAIVPSSKEALIPTFDFNKPFPTLNVQNWEGRPDQNIKMRSAPDTLFIMFNGHGQHESVGPYTDRKGTGVEI